MIAPWRCNILLSDFDKIYGHIIYEKKKILDIGGFIGDTALYFT